MSENTYAMRIRRLYTILLLSLVLGGCNFADNRNQVANQNVGSAPMPSPAGEAKVNQLTLPVLDALLANESFVRQIKESLALTDQQISSLKTISSTEVTRLRQADAEQSPGDAADARARATQEIAEIIGQDKGRLLEQMARTFWAKGVEDTEDTTGKQAALSMSNTPNSVPGDTRVVVNIPAFRMDLFRDGSLIKTYKIGIGYPQFPLPQGLRKAQTIIFNPTWTPPDSPWVATMKNVSAGQKIEAGSKLNPLGPIKIPIGMPSLIHGGKSPAKLGHFASHGCVGLTNDQVKDFARLLAEASGTEISSSVMAKYLADRTRTQAVKLKETVPVELRYETIVVENGQIHIFKDVYDEGTNTEENLRAVLEANGVRPEDLSADEKAKITEALNAMSAHPKKMAPVELQPSTNDNSQAQTKKRKTLEKNLTANKTEVVVEVAALMGRGYPAPLDLDTGTARRPERSAASTKRGPGK